MAISIPANEKNVRCLLLAPTFSKSLSIEKAVLHAASASGVQLVSIKDPPLALAHGETVTTEIMRSDFVIGISQSDALQLYYDLGFAHAAGKSVVMLHEEGDPSHSIGDFIPVIKFTRANEGLSRLYEKLRMVFEEIKDNPQRFRKSLKDSTRPAIAPTIDFESLERIEPREFENLCFELLTQMGFKKVEWGKEIKEIDVVATLPKKDPDGFLYEELWLVSMGLNSSIESIIDMMWSAGDRLYRHLSKRNKSDINTFFSKNDTPITTPVTFLYISYRSSKQMEIYLDDFRRLEHRAYSRHFDQSIRFRTWDQQRLISLLQQHPQIAYKYFSEEGRSQSKYRKSPEELYLENVELTNRLQSEQDRRIKAERDAVWKDVAFKAAHKLGNPIFALETGLQALKRRLSKESDIATQIAEEMGESVEKAKEIIEQFKSLIKAQEINPRPTELISLIKSASRVAEENGVEVVINRKSENLVALVDSARMTECFDELFANALHWLDKQHKKIEITLDAPEKNTLPASIDPVKRYVRVRFEDNGCGVKPEQKEKIFAPFMTTYAHGTGLGLSLVQWIIEGHGGMIQEIGKPDVGAIFELYLPQANQN